ncbi:hypothetical protein ACERK3_02365 [Phycisphaerales bacterium AB-hyl4]|uniref:Transposase IS200-like domain-containing protein n=1 Tax=Natronomicrosphaera hydrolytica TaxID=3242702 RepID=A0ABV4U1T7_9BACT
MPAPWNNWYHCMGNTYGTWLPGDPRGFRTRHHREHVEGDYKFPPPPGIYDDLFERSKQLLKRPTVYFPAELRPAVCRLFADTLRDDYKAEVVELSVGGIHYHLLARFVPVGMDPYEHLENLGIKLTHARKNVSDSKGAHTPKAPPRGGGGPRPGGRGLSARGRSTGGHSTRGLSAYDHDPVPRRILGLARSWVTHELKQRGHFCDVPAGLWARRPKVEPIRNRGHQLAAVNYIRRHATQHGAVFSQLL